MENDPLNTSVFSKKLNVAAFVLKCLHIMNHGHFIQTKSCDWKLPEKISRETIEAKHFQIHKPFSVFRFLSNNVSRKVSMGHYLKMTLAKTM